MTTSINIRTRKNNKCIKYKADLSIFKVKIEDISINVYIFIGLAIVKFVIKNELQAGFD
jgi:hypothetical protein